MVELAIIVGLTVFGVCLLIIAALSGHNQFLRDQSSILNNHAQMLHRKNQQLMEILSEHYAEEAKAKEM